MFHAKDVPQHSAPLLLVEGFTLFLRMSFNFGVFALNFFVTVPFFVAGALLTGGPAACTRDKCCLPAGSLVGRQLQNKALGAAGLALSRMPNQHDCHAADIDRALSW